nr:hypothetical protein [Neobacillus sp. Marseille-Q6967]
MSDIKQNKISAEDANIKMSKQFKDYSERGSNAVNSEAERANQEIQEQFYGDNEENQLLPFHIDVNNPPIKK